MTQLPSQSQLSMRTEMCSASSRERIHVGKREHEDDNDNSYCSITAIAEMMIPQYQDNKKRKISSSEVIVSSMEKVSSLNDEQRLLNDWNEFCASSDQMNVLFSVLVSKFTEFQSLPEHVLYQTMISQLEKYKTNPNS